MVRFTARRGNPEMVTPARATPRETKSLSDMDDHPGHLVYIPLLEFFRRREAAAAACLRAPEDYDDTAKAVKAALAEALVWYYPIAGRLREIAGGKLVVDCTAEGVAFVEADADVRLEELGVPLLPPFPCVDELLCDAGDIGVVVGKPVIFLQVTRFRCGGFVMGFHISHCIADGFGMIQFMKAIVDIARGQQAPMPLPVWERDLLTARLVAEQPSTNVIYPKLKSVIKNSTSIIDDIMVSAPQQPMVGKYFFFGLNEISALRSHLNNVRNSDDDDSNIGTKTTTRLELITAVIWRCRTVALGYNPGQRVHFLFTANARRHRGDGTLQIPEGYYGNALTYHVAGGVTVNELCCSKNTLSHTVGLIREAKMDTTEEHVRSTVDFLASLRGRRFPADLGFDKTYAVSDFTRLGEDGLDFGWAERVGGGVATPSFVSFHSRYKLMTDSDGDGDGEEVVVASMMLPKPSMDRFDKELAVWLTMDHGNHQAQVVVMLMFKANRSDPKLVSPASPTPQEIKVLSDVDTQLALRFYATGVEFFCQSHIADGHVEPKDPAKVIKDALAKALMYFYPMAGRIRELSTGKFIVECTGEGVIFVEADVDMQLDKFGNPIIPPYPCVDEFLCDPADTSVIIGKPLVFMQVTRLKCGGFVIGTYSCHIIVDAFGHTQFLKAIADIARGDDHPTVFPMWERELMTARNPPDVTRLQHFITSKLYLGEDSAVQPMLATNDMVGEYFLFGPREIAALQHHAQVQHSSTTFEIITAAMWKCRTVALGHAPDQKASLLITMNARGKWKHDPPLPQGFYGNGFVYLVVETAASDLCKNSLGYAVDLVQKAKLDMTEEFTKSMVDFIALHGGPPYVPGWTFVVSDITRIGEDALDFGWAKRIGGGVPMVGDIKSKQVSYQMRCKNDNDEDCVVASMFLPKLAMEMFAKHIFMLSKEIK
uniref:Uncharacterized protein n=1 Tax=Leersia perrieri TaxID=77586 RepID=A0A0D9XH82_9ORYZ